MESDLLTQTYETTAPDTRLGQLRSTLTEDSTDTVLVVDNGIEGAVAPRDLLRSRLSDDAQVRAVMDTVPQPGLGTDPRKLARVLVESEATAAPVVDEAGTVHGVVTRDSLFRAVVDDSDAPVAGMVTKSDALRALTPDEREAVEVALVNPDYLRATDRDEVAEHIADIVEQYRELSVVDARVTFQRHEEDHRGDSLVRCEARLFTDADQVAGTAEEYGADNALRSALETLERNVLELKGEQTEPEQPDGTPPAAERSGEELSDAEER